MSSKLVQRIFRSLEKLSESEEISQKEWRQLQRLVGDVKVEGIESDSSDSDSSDSDSDSSGSSSGSGSDSDSDSESEVDQDSSADFEPDSDSSSSSDGSYHTEWKKFKKENADMEWNKKKMRKEFLKYFNGL